MTSATHSPQSAAPVCTSSPKSGSLHPFVSSATFLMPTDLALSIQLHPIRLEVAVEYIRPGMGYMGPWRCINLKSTAPRKHAEVIVLRYQLVRLRVDARRIKFFERHSLDCIFGDFIE